MSNIKNIITMIVLLVGLNANASVEPIITGSDSKVFTVNLADWASYEVSVSITDADGNVLIYDDLDNEPGKIYNLKELTNGIYNVAVSNFLKTINSSIVINQNNVSILATSTTFKPVVNVHDDYIDVNALTQGSKVTVDIIGEEGIAFSTTYANTPTLSKRFVTENLPAGYYTVVVSKADVSTTKTFVK